MNPPPGPILGALSDLPVSNRMFKAPPVWLSDAFLIVGVGLALLLVLAGGIYVWMKARRRRRRHVSGGEKVYRGSRGQAEVSDGEQPEELEPAVEPPAEIEHDADDDSDSDDHHHHHGRRRYKYRVRRRTHRSRNPTLSETGGLPPVKAQEPTKPF
jgi:hypothetical protein